MPRPKNTMNKLILASNNQGKLKELQLYLSDLSFTVIPQSEFNVTEVEETGLSFIENAIIKARHAAISTGLPSLADDSGLEIDALQGAPGVISARYAGVEKSDDANIEKVLADLEGVSEDQRTARFHSALQLMGQADDPMPRICQERWEGRILFDKQGDKGFGYDPIFYVPTHNCSAAELPSDTKNDISHRGQAMLALVNTLRANP